jgi:hypothetical protein
MAINFNQGDEDELTFLKARMRNDQFLGLDRLLIEEQDIEIDGPWPPPERLLPSQPRFDLSQRSQEFAGLKICLDLNGRVHEPVLVENTQRLSLVERRSSKEPVAINPQDLTKTLFTLVDFVTKIRTYPDVGDVSHPAWREKIFGGSLLFCRLFRFLLFELLRRGVNLILFFGGGFPEVADPFAQTLADLREFTGPKNNEDDHQDDQ